MMGKDPLQLALRIPLSEHSKPVLAYCMRRTRAADAADAGDAAARKRAVFYAGRIRTFRTPERRRR